MRLHFFAFLSIFFLADGLFGQTEWIKIDSVRFVGLRKTRLNYALRELDFGKGDSLETAFLEKRLETNRQFLRNTGLFSDIQIALLDGPEKGRAVAEIIVKEGFFILPVPICELADRNFNVWWTDHGRSLRYVNYGLWITHSNATGRGDRLRLRANFGYSNRYEIGYLLPAFNRKKTLGLDLGAIWQRRREIGYRTSGNRLQLFFDPNRPVFWRLEAKAALIWRPKLRWTHRAEAVFFQNRVADTLAAALNPDFFLKKKARQTVAGLVVETRFEGRDNRFYALSGTSFWLEMRKTGWRGGDMNAFSATAELGKWLRFSKKWSLEGIVRGKKALLRDSIPYHNYAAIGYGQTYLRGYEYYVVDGADFGLLKFSLRREMLDRIIEQDPDLVPIRALQRIPIRAYLSANADFGYVRDPFFGLGNPLANRFLRGGGIGLDVVVLNDKAFQIEASVNHLGQIGLFFHFKTEF